MADEPGKPDDPDGPESEDEEARRFILSRRAKFVTAALAGAGITAGVVVASRPQPCLSPVYVPVPGEKNDAQPQVCLLVDPRLLASALARQDAGAAPATEPHAPDAAAPGASAAPLARPKKHVSPPPVAPCLVPMPTPPVCLSAPPTRHPAPRACLTEIGWQRPLPDGDPDPETEI